MELQTINILHIDDDEDEYFLVKDLLMDIEGKFYSYNITWVSDCRDALEEIRKDENDVYLIDYQLGERTGLDLLQEEEVRHIDKPIIMITGMGNREIDLRAMEAGASDYLVKGEFNGAMLERAIRYSIERKKLLNQVKALSLVDELTGLSNRRGFKTLGTQQLNMARRTGRGMLLFYIDLNNMKKINDAYGHDEGDRALKETAAILRKTFRQSDITARLGGDEFAVLALEVELKYTETLRKRLEENIRESNESGKHPFAISLSVGVSRYDAQNPKYFEELLKEADEEMYREKKEFHKNEEQAG